METGSLLDYSDFCQDSRHFPLPPPPELSQSLQNGFVGSERNGGKCIYFTKIREVVVDGKAKRNVTFAVLGDFLVFSSLEKVRLQKSFWLVESST